VQQAPASAARMSSTSSSMSSAAQKTGSSGKQTAQTGISRFLIGEELGRGAYGQVRSRCLGGYSIAAVDVSTL
jgi:hypothetical protein